MRLTALVLISLGLLACGDDDVIDGGVDASRPNDASAGDAGAGDASPGDAGETSDAASPDAASPMDGGIDVSAPDAGDGVVTLFPRTGIRPDELGVIVNDDDPLSVSTAAAYVAMRGIPEANVVHVNMAVNARITRGDFQGVYDTVNAALPATVQATVLTWTAPYRVDCMSITSAFAFGFDERWCNTSGGACGVTAPSSMYRSTTTHPFDDLSIRPSMMLAAATEEDALALIERGIASDGTLPSGDGYLLRTTDRARSVRWLNFDYLPELWAGTIDLTYIDNSAGDGSNVVRDTENILFYFTGLARVPDINTNTYRPGAIADHLTSFGGRIPSGGQMSVIDWLKAGATGSYGTVAEPCNYQQKFPIVGFVLDEYFRGATLIESYWRSVEWPGEGLFVGEPLARPFENQVARVEADQVVLETNALMPNDTGWVVEGADSADGPWTLVMEVEAPTMRSRTTINVPRPTPSYLRLTQN